MMMLGVLCLLIGSTTSSPIQKDYRSEAAAPVATNFMPQQFPASYWGLGRGVSSDPGSSSSLPNPPNPSSGKVAVLPAPQDAIYSAGPSSYSSKTNMAEGLGYYGGFPSYSDEGYNSHKGSEYGVAYAPSQSSGYDSSASGGGYGGGYGSSASAYVGDSSYGFVAAPQDENWSSESAASYGDESPEPVFSDVSDLEPVYSFSSRSRYQRGRAVFAQTRYTPGEPVPPYMPQSRGISNTNSKQSSPAKAPTKGGY